MGPDPPRWVDGNENPTGRSAAAAELIGAKDPEFRGGSYVIVQKYLHDLAAWQALSTEQQDRVIGRTKFDDIELVTELMLTNMSVGKPADNYDRILDVSKAATGTLIATSPLVG